MKRPALLALGLALALVAIAPPARAAQKLFSDGLTTAAADYFPLGGGVSLLFNGTSYDRARTPYVFKSVSALNASSETAIWTPATGKKFRLMGFMLAAGSASTLTIKDGTGLATILVVPVGTAPTTSPPLGNGILSGAANRVLTGTGIAALTGYVFGTEE